MMVSFLLGVHLLRTAQVSLFVCVCVRVCLRLSTICILVEREAKGKPGILGSLLF